MDYILKKIANVKHLIEFSIFVHNSILIQVYLNFFSAYHTHTNNNDKRAQLNQAKFNSCLHFQRNCL